VSIWFHPAAEIEHLDHVAYYESRRKGLGSGYLAEFEKVLATVAQGPHRFPLIGTGKIRRAHMRRFPMTILFQEVGADLHILAVAHKRRRPTYWVTRL
jgi:hypothetical protein